MKIALVSDVHGNLEALDAVLFDIRERGIKEVVCLGDLVGYGANPNECVELIRGLARPVIAGNHDWAVLGKTDYSNFNPVARAAVEWTKNNTKGKNLEYLDCLDLVARITKESVCLVHATPKKPEEWSYLFDLIDFREQFQFFDEHICCIGHSHEPLFVQAKGASVRLVNENPLSIQRDFRYIINVGSVGQPRDLDSRASYAVIDADEQTAEIVRVTYDIPKAQNKIMTAGLPEFLAMRLARGQ